MVKRGLARTALLALAFLLTASLAAGWLALGGRRSAGSADPSAPIRPRASDPATPDPATRVAERAPRARPDGTAAPADDDPARFVGRGRIRGELLTDGLAVPTRWTLVLEPNPTLVGAERAARRRVEFDDGRTQFEAADLPLGGYLVRAEAPSVNSSRASVLLVRGSSDVFVSLRLAPAGLVDGFVLDHAGMPAAEILVSIENLDTRLRAQADTDAAGAFLFTGVVDGEYEIRFGEFESPLVPPGNFTFRAPTLRWRETRLPPTGSARVLVADASGSLLPDVELVGSASPRGVLRGRTAPDGAFVALHLLPGRYALTAQAPDGRVGRAAFDVESDNRADVRVVVE